MKITIEIQPDSDAFEQRKSYEMYKVFEQAYKIVTDEQMDYGRATLKDSDGVVVGKLDIEE